MSTIPSMSSTTYGNASGTSPIAAPPPQAAATLPQSAEVPESKAPPALPAGMVMIDAATLAQLMARAIQPPATTITQTPIATAVQGPVPTGPSSVSHYTFTDGSTSGATYVGDMRNGLPHGKGTKTYLPSHYHATYTGDFVEGMLEGEGILISRNGHQYSGQFKNNKFNGKGRLDTEKGGHKIGTWEDGILKEGSGIVYYDGGEKYVGQLQEDKKHGQGRYDQKDGSYLEGRWENGLIADGTWKWYDDTYKRFWTYTGTFKDGKKWNGKDERFGVYKNGQNSTCVVS